LDAPNQALIVAFGTLSLYALTIVIITTQKAIKRKMSFRAWKNIHLILWYSYLICFPWNIYGSAFKK
jgi:DMSO/TMAO reductase YedYZ heme-binding membrane subunit